MANSKISALTSATTPLAGTETLPIVQSGATVKATVANITGSGLYAGSFTTLASTGNTTLGDASTDTVRINGYAGVGIAPSNNIALQIGSTALSGAGPIGFYSNPTGPATATTSVRGIVTRADTAAAAFTVADVMQISLSNSTKGAGSTITNQHGAYIADQTNGTNNYGITSLVSSGTNKWNIYASGTADNYAAGNWKFAAAKGVNFTANTPTAGMTSQLLNWYEEGTWTPNQGSGLTVIGTFSSLGTYTRIGRQVTILFQIASTTSVAVTAGGVICTNAPFTSIAGFNSAGTVHIRNTQGTQAMVGNSSTNVYVGGAIAAVANFQVSITYFV